MVKVKICGLCRLIDVEIAHDAGADALGFVLEPSSPRYFSSEIPLTDLNKASGLLSRVAVFGAFLPQSQVSGFDVIQAFAESLSLSPESRTIPVFRLSSATTITEALTQIGQAPIFLLDPFDPEKSGGTGHSLDWGLVAEIRQATPGQKLILAGGLNPQNVEAAVRQVQPYAVDASSGLEDSPGIKNADKVKAFIANAKSAGQ